MNKTLLTICAVLSLSVSATALAHDTVSSNMYVTNKTNNTVSFSATWKTDVDICGTGDENCNIQDFSFDTDGDATCVAGTNTDTNTNITCTLSHDAKVYIYQKIHGIRGAKIDSELRSTDLTFTQSNQWLMTTEIGSSSDHSHCNDDKPRLDSGLYMKKTDEGQHHCSFNIDDS